MERITVADPASLAEAAADVVAEEVEQYDQVMLGLAGGSTPRATHEILATRPIDWSGVTAWIADERWVPPDHEDANQAMVRSSLTDERRIPFLAPDTTLSTPTRAAVAYADSVVPRITDRSTRTVLMLGIGADGHTASLFPGTSALDIPSPSFVANFVPQLDTWRLTATFPLIAAADVVLFLVSGAAKAEAVAAIADGEPLPAGRVTARERVLWILDQAAASRLTADG